MNRTEGGARKLGMSVETTTMHRRLPHLVYALERPGE